jgi:hypothetical protein
MKIPASVLLVILFGIGCGNPNTEGYSDNLSSVHHSIKESAHTEAKNLLVDDFFWSRTEETAPFGNGFGSDAFNRFSIRRSVHENEGVIGFLNILLETLNYPAFNLQETSSSKVEKYITSPTPVDTGSIKISFSVTQDENGLEIKKEEDLKAVVVGSANNMGYSNLLRIDNTIIGGGLVSSCKKVRLMVTSDYLQNVPLKDSYYL